MLQEYFLVGGLDLCEVALNAVELGAIRDIEDLCDVKLFEEALGILGLVHAEVVEEQREVPPAQLLRELPHESKEYLCVDGQGMDDVVDETSVLTNGGDERQSLNFQIGVIDLDTLLLMCPALGPKCSEGKHRLVEVDYPCL